jgi:hypothetical protein
MRKSLIAQSVATLVGSLGLAAAANAAVVAPPAGTVVAGVPEAVQLQVNTDYIGHINLVPYYSVASGNDTYINITNTDTKNGKAVKVRFRGASNSDDVYDITVLMSPGDVWAAAITKDAATDLPRLTHNDKTCTLPFNVKGNFVTARLDPTVNAAEKAAQAREGYVEILNMADIPYNAAATSLFQAIKHVNGTPPCHTTVLSALFRDSTGATPALSYADAQSKGLEVPTTGLMTNWTVINVPKAAAYTGAAIAVEARTAAGLPGWGNIVLFPQAASPVSPLTVNNFTSDPLLRNVVAGGAVTTAAIIPAAEFDFPDLSTPYTVTAAANPLGPLVQAWELTRALAVTSTTNEFVTDPAILGKTNWVFSMPTRRYSVAFNYAGENAAARRVFTDLTAGGVLPLNNYFTSTNTTVSGRQLCVGGITTAVAISASSIAEPTNRRGAVTANREEGFLSSPDEFVISPGTPTAPLTFCGEVSVLGFNSTNPLGASITLKDITSTTVDGWMRISHPGLANVGLPIIGSMMTELFNSAVASGTAGAYGQTFPHRHSRP